MSRGRAIGSVLLVLSTSVAVRIVAAAMIPFPKPEDTAYYVGVARNLLEGRGLVSDALWSFGTPPLTFPRAAFEVWLPLPTFLAALPMAVGGHTFTAAQVSSVVVGAMVPILAWWFAAGVARERGLPPGRTAVVALASGLTAAVYLPLVLHSALPDSTMPFAALALLACALMAQIIGRAKTKAEAPVMARWGWLVVTLGVTLGLAALTRNEAIWLAATWVIVVAVARPVPARERAAMIGLTGLVAFAVYAPWAARDWIAFGTPLPGQALANALSLDGRDIFAWSDPPTLQRYLDAGAATLLGLRVTGMAHNTLNVLLFLGMPVSLIGLVGLWWVRGSRLLRPLVTYSAITFLATGLLFPVATTWGTFLHAAGAIQVLLVVSAMSAIDAVIATVGRRQGWTRPVAWLGIVVGVGGSLLFTAALLPAFGAGARDSARLFDALGTRLAAAGHPLGPSSGPVISNVPIWLAETTRASTLALPDEPPRSVLDLAAHFPGTRYLVLVESDWHHWPADLEAGAPGAECFRPVALPPWSGTGPDPLADTTVYEIVCPGPTAAASAP